MKYWIFVFAWVLSSCTVARNKSSEIDGNGEREKSEILNDLWRDGEFGHLVKKANKLTRMNPDADGVWSMKAWGHLMLEELAESERGFKRAISLNPKSDNAYVGLGTLSLKHGRLDDARDFCIKAMQIRAINSAAYSCFSNISLLEGDLDVALYHAKVAARLQPEKSEYAANLAIVLHELEIYSLRDIAYDKARDLGYWDMEYLDDIFSGKVMLDIPRAK